MTLVLIFTSGFLFAAGLEISGMTQPDKVSSFLNVTGHWDPSLILVMIGASSTYFVGQKIIVRRHPKKILPGRQPGKGKLIDKRLIGGSALFGLGWGMIGFCPGPALVVLPTGSLPVILFTVSMILGMIGYKLVKKYAV